MYEYLAAGDPSARDPHGVVDGDTLNVTIDLGFHITHHNTLRLYGVNAPEMRTPEGPPAKQFVIDWLDKHCPDGTFIIRTIKDKREKYGRYLADVWDMAMVHSLNVDLVGAGHAVPYYPTPRPTRLAQ